MGKMISQKEYENMQKQEAEKKILWNEVQAKEKEPSETSKKKKKNSWEEGGEPEETRHKIQMMREIRKMAQSAELLVTWRP